MRKITKKKNHFCYDILVYSRIIKIFTTYVQLQNTYNSNISDYLLY